MENTSQETTTADSQRRTAIKRAKSGIALVFLVFGCFFVFATTSMNASAGSLQAYLDEGTVEVASASSAELTAYRPAGLTCATNRHDIWGETKAEAIEVLPDGGFVVVGYVHRCPKITDFEIDGWVARFATDGAMLWSRSYSIWDQTWARAIALHPDGGFVVTGGVAPDARELMNNTDIALWRIDADGRPVWARVLDKPASEDKVNDILALQGGDVVLAGFVAPGNAPDDRQGYCADEYAYSADNGTNSVGGAAMGSIFGAERNLPCMGFVARFDDAGVLVWQNHIEGSADNLAFQSLHKEEGELVLVGRSMGKPGSRSTLEQGFPQKLTMHHSSELFETKVLALRVDPKTGKQTDASVRPGKPSDGEIYTDTWVSSKARVDSAEGVLLEDYYHEDWSLCALGTGFQSWYRVDLHYLSEPKGLGSQFTAAQCFPQVTLEGNEHTPVVKRFPYPGRIQDHTILTEDKAVLIGAREVQYNVPILIDPRPSSRKDESRYFEDHPFLKGNLSYFELENGKAYKITPLCIVSCKGRDCMGSFCNGYPFYDVPAEFYQTRVGTWLWWLNSDGDVLRDQRLDRMYFKHIN